jgi:hypothetical protein
MRQRPRPDRSVDSFVPRQKTWNDRDPARDVVPMLLLAVVTDRAAISGQNARWTYTCDEAIIGSSGSILPQTKNGLAEFEGLTGMTCYSISELSNTATPTHYSYGVPSGDLPVGYAPKPIHIGCYVLLTPARFTHGAQFWLIINTQAISGTCP